MYEILNDSVRVGTIYPTEPFLRLAYTVLFNREDDPFSQALMLSYHCRKVGNKKSKPLRPMYVGSMEGVKFSVKGRAYFDNSFKGPFSQMSLLIDDIVNFEQAFSNYTRIWCFSSFSVKMRPVGKDTLNIGDVYLHLVRMSSIRIVFRQMEPLVENGSY